MLPLWRRTDGARVHSAEESASAWSSPRAPTERCSCVTPRTQPDPSSPSRSRNGVPSSAVSATPSSTSDPASIPLSRPFVADGGPCWRLELHPDCHYVQEKQ